MPLPIISATMRVTARGVLPGGQLWTNTWHAATLDSTPWDASKITAFHAIFKQIYQGPAVGAGLPVSNRLVSPGQSTDVVYTPLDGLSASIVFNMLTVGTGSGDPLPPQVAAVLTIRTAHRGRQNRGRIYFPGTGEGDNGSNGTISAVVTAGWPTQVTGVQGQLVTAQFTLGVGSYGPYKPGQIPTPVPHFTPATSFTMDNKWDTQRRRVI